MKKLLLWLIVLIVCISTVMVLSSTGCKTASSSAETAVEEISEDTEEVSDGEKITLTISVDAVEDADRLAILTEEFESLNPDIDVVLEPMPYEAQRDKFLMSFLQKEATYDIIEVDNPWVEEFYKAGWIVPVDDYIANTPDYNWDDFAEPLRKYFTVDDHIIGPPYYNYILAMVVREDLFADKELQDKFKSQYNKELAIPLTLDDYVEVSKFFKENADIYGAAMQPQRGYKIVEEWTNYLFAEGGRIMDEDENILINSDASRKALEKYIEVYDNAAPPNSLNWGLDEALRCMQGGEGATMISFNWMLTTLNNPEGASGDLAGKFALYPVPGGKSVFGAFCWGIAHNCPNKDAAWKYMAWMSSVETEKKRVILGGAPCRMSAGLDEEVWEQGGYGEEYYKTILEVISDCEPLAYGLHAEEVIIETGTILNAAVDKQITVDEAINSIDQKLKEIVSKE